MVLPSALTHSRDLPTYINETAAELARDHNPAKGLPSLALRTTVRKRKSTPAAKH